MTARQNPAPLPAPTRGFFRQGVCILLPVGVLAAACLISLRQDRLLARHEAVEKAQSAAESLAQAFWDRLFDRTALEKFREHTFRLSARGDLISPSPAPGL